MTIASPTDIFFDQLRDLKSANEQTDETLPDLVRWSTEPTLAEALGSYHQAIRRHRQEMQAIFAAHSREAGEDVCKAMAGLIEGGNAHLQAAADATVRDILVIAHCNRIGHYLRSAAEVTLAMARKCGLTTEADVIFEVLDRQEDFTWWLSEVSADGFDIELGGIR